MFGLADKIFSHAMKIRVKVVKCKCTWLCVFSFIQDNLVHTYTWNKYLLIIKSNVYTGIKQNKSVLYMKTIFALRHYLYLNHHYIILIYRDFIWVHENLNYYF